MLRYRESARRGAGVSNDKALLATRPIYHQTDEAIRGHVFCTFLALVLRKELRGAAARGTDEARMA